MGCGSRGAFPPAWPRTRGGPGAQAKERLHRDSKTPEEPRAGGNRVLCREQPVPAELGCGGVRAARERSMAGGAAHVRWHWAECEGAGPSGQLGVSLPRVGRPLLLFCPQTSPICCSCIYTPSNFRNVSVIVSTGCLPPSLLRFDSLFCAASLLPDNGDLAVEFSAVHSLVSFVLPQESLPPWVSQQVSQLDFSQPFIASSICSPLRLLQHISLIVCVTGFTSSSCLVLNSTQTLPAAPGISRAFTVVRDPMLHTVVLSRSRGLRCQQTSVVSTCKRSLRTTPRKSDCLRLWNMFCSWKQLSKCSFCVFQT